MKKVLLAFAFMMSCMQLFAQKFEFSLLANSALFRYSGSYAVSSSFINEGTTPAQSYTNNPYGSKNGFGYGTAVQGQYITKRGFIAGLQAGYDWSQSKEDINYVYPDYYNIYPEIYTINTPIVETNGQSYLRDQYINLNPYIGYRLKVKNIKIDLMPGAEFGFNVNSYDKGSATAADGTVYKTDYKLKDAPVDIRLKFGIAAWYKRYGIIASYEQGLTNYTKNLVSTPYEPPIIYYTTSNSTGSAANTSAEAYSRLFRFGIAYRIF